MASPDVYTDMTIPSQKTQILGAGYDDTLCEALLRVLMQLGAERLSHNWGVAGSQELESLEVLVGGDRILIEAETYIGLSICGPVEVVERIGGMVAAAMKQS